MNETRRKFSPQVQSVIDEFVPILKAWAQGRYAITIGGSHGKDTWDSRSDVDLRLFCDNDVPRSKANPEGWKAYFAAVEAWKQKGVKVDGVWIRRIDQVDAAINSWINGEGATLDLEWTIWGYHLLPDIYHMAIIEDPDGVIAEWKQRLSKYSPKLKQAILQKNLSSLKYWRSDYHYQNKVERGDTVFLAGLSSRLVHEIILILYALNETYYVGDGQNLDFMKDFNIIPADFNEKVNAILYPVAYKTIFNEQYDHLCKLIDEVILLAETGG